MTEQSWEQLFHSVPCGLLATTGDGRVTSANNAFVTWSGHERDAVVGSYFMDHLTLGSKIFFETRLIPLLREHGVVQEMALDLVRADGVRVPLFVNARLLTDAVGPGDSISMAVFDATGRRDYERNLLAARKTAEAAIERVRILQQAAFDFSAASNRAELGVALVRAVRRASDAVLVGILSVNDDGSFAEWEGVPGLGITVPEGIASPQSEVVSSRTAIVCTDQASIELTFPELAAVYSAQHIEALCAIPVEHGGDIRGVVVCAFGRPRRLDQDLVDLLTALVTQAVVVLQGIVLHEQLTHQALHDSLTGLPNRPQSRRRLSQTLASAARHRRSVAVVFIDLDGFKAINDTLGHSAGDDTLRQVSARLSAVVRAGDVVARLGGDEFLILCDDIDEVGALSLAERVRDIVKQPLDRIPESLALSASIGISIRPPGDDEVSAEQMISSADEAMYASKRAGKDRTTSVVVGAKAP